MNKEIQQNELWNVQLNILDVIDQICRKNNLRYSLYAGTLLGAVRHQGFIPWDDDLDICMPREDYEKFLEIWKDEEYPGYILQNKRNTPSFTQTFSKIRKDHTTYLQYEWEKERYHTGIFVDIFPIDRAPVSFPQKTIFRWQCVKYLLYTREFVPPKASLLIKLISRIILILSTKDRRLKYREKFEKKLQELSIHNELPTTFIEVLDTIKKTYPIDLTDNYIELSFEGKKYPCFAKWDKYLKTEYGNYMELPSEKDRVWKHNHLIIDFDHNYGEKS